MDADAQRLIALSLGKIALSRGQRGGQRLHKSLLVAGVLFNARTVACVGPSAADHTYDDDEDGITGDDASMIITDNFGADDQEREFSRCHAVQQAPVCTTSISELSVPVCWRQQYMLDKSASSTVIGLTDISVAHETINDLKFCKSSLHAVGTSTIIPELTVINDASWSDSSREIDLQQQQYSCVSPTSRGTFKRRNETIYETNDSCKRFRYDVEETRLCCELTSFSDASSNTEPMQTDNVQSLVHSFSAGFSGLLRSIEPVDNSTSNCYFGIHNDDCHESSSESIISCSTQIREALETLSRPILAMSV